MLYKQGTDEKQETAIEKFEFIHIVAIVLLIILIAVAVISPDILFRNISSIGKDFGVTL